MSIFFSQTSSVVAILILTWFRIYVVLMEIVILLFVLTGYSSSLNMLNANAFVLQKFMTSSI